MIIIVDKKKESNLYKVNFKKLKFGVYYSDHMFISKFEHNNWNTSQICPFKKLNISPNCLAFHYGQAIFEGMKAYKDINEDIFLFRPYDNFNRMNVSAQRLQMPLIPKNIFMKGLKKLINIDKKWIPKNYGESLYIRPFMIATGDVLMAGPSNKYLFIIISTPSGSYYNKSLKVKIEEKYSRASIGGVGFVKAAGNYAASFYPTKLAQNKGYDQILWTDSATHSFIEESGTMNVFFHLFNGELITPPISDSILGGITRSSIITLAKNKKIKVIEKNISIKEILELINNNKIQEAFGCGTAAVTKHFTCIGYKNQDYFLPTIQDNHRLSWILKKELLDIQHNISQDIFNWRLKI